MGPKRAQCEILPPITRVQEKWHWAVVGRMVTVSQPWKGERFVKFLFPWLMKQMAVLLQSSGFLCFL